MASIDIDVWYISTVTHSTTARLFTNGRSQAVRLPREFRFEGDRVKIRAYGRGVLLEPLDVDVDDWFADLDRFGHDLLDPRERNQPRTPVREIDLA